MGKINITPEALALSGAQFRKDLLKMPVHAMKETLQYMTLRRGIRYAETVGELTGDIDLGPYSKTRIDDNDMAIKGRTLYTYLGSVVKKFEPNSVVKSIYDSAITKGEELKNVNIALAVLAYLTAKLGHNLQTHIWNAVRNDQGTTSADLFNGFDTITAAEISADTPTISTTIGNLFEFDEAITSSNAVDQIVAFCEAASELLVDNGQRVNLYCSPAIYRNYLKDYQATVGAIPYNTEYRKAVVEGFENVHFVPLYNKANSDYIHLSPASNMLVGVNQEGEEENITVEKHEAFVLQYIATMFFGVQFESINPERLLVGKLAAATSNNAGGGSAGGSTSGTGTQSGGGSDAGGGSAAQSKVATPTFDPASWTEGETLTVELATETDGASIYYTTNGDTPTAESTAYDSTNKITLSATTTIKAIAVKEGMTASDVATKAYTKPE